MKFARLLEDSSHPAFKQYYIAYKDLKKAIKLIAGEALPPEESIAFMNAGPITRTAENQFQEMLDRELNKINSFSAVQFSALTEEIRELIYRITHPSTSIDGETEEGISELRDDIVAFEAFIRLNFTGFRKALKKFDKWNKSDSSQWFLQRIVRSDFMLIPIDRLLFGLSLVESVKRNTFNRINGCDSAFLAMHKSPCLFKRTKYFVSAEDLVKIETELLRSCDAIYAFPLTFSVPSELEGFAQRFGGGGRSQFMPAEIGFVESVVIFENKDFTQTAARRSKQVSTDFGGYPEPVFSLRWNQAQHREGKCTVVFETHPKYTASSQAKVFQKEVHQKTVLDFINKKIGLNAFISNQGWSQTPDLTEFITAFSTCVSKSAPSALYSYRRTLLQSSQSSIIIALDKDIKFLDLQHFSGSSFFSAQISQFQSMLSQRVMTVWQNRSLESPPDFLTKILGNPSISQVSGFTKAIHAETILHVVTDATRPAPVGLPRWFIHTVSSGECGAMQMTGPDVDFAPSPLASPSSGKFDVLPKTDANSKLLLHDLVSAKEPKLIRMMSSDISAKAESGSSKRTPLPTVSPLVGSDLQAPLLDRSSEETRARIPEQSLIDQVKYILFGSVAPEIPEPSSKIEPKTFLANERTFLNWCFVSFILQAAAVTLVSVDPTAHFEGSILSLVALITLVWSLNVYRLRVIALRSMKPLDALLVSSNGVSFVSLSVAFALTVTWIGRVRKYVS